MARRSARRAKARRESWVLEPLQAHHDRLAFQSRSPELNRLLRNLELEDPPEATWVAVPHPGSSQILGYYSLEPDPVALRAGTASTPGPVPVLLLKYLAVSRAHEGRGIGTDLLGAAVARAADLADDNLILALVLDPLDEKAQAWYLRRSLPFVPLWENDPLARLVLPMSTTKQAYEQLFGSGDD